MSTLELKPQDETVLEAVHRALLNKLAAGEYWPGEHLFLEELTEELGVSTTPVVGALNILVAEGLVSKRANRGFFVAKYTPQQLHDLYELRAVIEGSAAAYMAIRGSDEQIALLWNLIKQLEERTGDRTAYRETDLAFHLYLVDNCGTDTIATIGNGDNIIRATFLPGIVTAQMTSNAPWDTLHEHHKIVQAIEKRDEQQARQAAYQHVTGIAARYLANTEAVAIARSGGSQ